MKSPQRSELIQNILQNIGTMSRLGAGCISQNTWPQNMPTHAQLGIMFSLMHHKEQGIKGLSTQFGVSPSAITQLVNALVLNGFLVRTKNTKDRRSVRIDLTPKGRRMLEKAKNARMIIMATMFEPLADQELEQFLQLQQKMSAHFQQTCLKK